MTSLRRHEGYLLIENPMRAPLTPLEEVLAKNPGVRKEQFVRPDPQTRTWESATYTCSHCHCIVVLNPGRTREREVCRSCMHVICDTCAMLKGMGTACKTYNALLEEKQTEAFMVLARQKEGIA